MTKETKRLTSEELERLSKELEKIEWDTYVNQGLRSINGGYTSCDMKDYDDEHIYVELTFGVQGDGENNFDEVEDITLDRETMEEV
jgi:hypothetical protein